MKEETVDGTGHFTLVLLVGDFLVTAHVHNEATKTRIAHQLGRLSQDRLIGVCIGGATGRGHEDGEKFEPWMGAPLDCSVHASHHQPLVQIEFQQGRAQQNLIILVGADQSALGRGHDVVLHGEGLHVLTHLRSPGHGYHFAKLLSEVSRSVDVHFQSPEEHALLHALQELSLRLLLAATRKVVVEKGLDVFLPVGPFLTIPLTFSDRQHRQVWNTLLVLRLLLRSLLSLPHEVQELDGLRRVGIRFGAQELFSGQPTSMTVPVTAVKLVGGLAASIVAINRQLPEPDAFLPPARVGAKVGETATHPGQSLVPHTPGLGRFQAVGAGGDPSGEQTHGHGLTQGPQVQGIGIIAEDSLHRLSGLAVLGPADLGVVFLGVKVEDDGGSTHYVIFEELSRRIRMPFSAQALWQTG